MKKAVRERIDALNNPEAVPTESRKRQRRGGSLSHSRSTISRKALQQLAPADREGAISLERMKALRIAGLTYEEIGRTVGCTEENVVQRLKPYREALEYLKAFQANKADLYDFQQSRLLSFLTDEKIMRSGLWDIVRSAQALEDMARKERGKDAVSSVTIFSMTVRAAHELPKNNANQGAGVIEGNAGDLRGDGIPEAVREGELPALPGPGDEGSPDWDESADRSVVGAPEPVRSE